MVKGLPNYFITSLAQTLNAGGNDSQIALSNLYTLDGQLVDTADFAAFGHGVLTIDPLNLNAVEFDEFTTVDPTIGTNGGVSGVTRGLSFTGYEQVSANVKFHPVGTPVLIAWGTHNIADLLTIIQDNYNTLLTLIQSAILQGAMEANQTITGIVRTASDPSRNFGNPTISISNPAVLTLNNHGLISGDTVVFSTTGVLPAAITPGSTYYVLSSGLTANTFEISATFNGTPIDTTGDTQSGVHTVNRTTPYALLVGGGQLKFGGTGADGALNVSSGMTTIDLGNAPYFEKNYTSISITGTGAIQFINPAPGGTVISLKSQGDVVLTSSAAPMIDASGCGAAGGVGGTPVGGAGSDGTPATDILNADSSNGKAAIVATSTPTNGGVGYTSQAIYSVNSNRVDIQRSLFITVGSGGGGGAAENGAGATIHGGAGGIGGGALIIECAGALNFTTANGISVAGLSGVTPANATAGSGGGGGGGGAGGMCVILYNDLTSASGTVNISGGSGGNGANGFTGSSATISSQGGGGGGMYNGAGGHGGHGGQLTSIGQATNGTNGSNSASTGSGGGIGGTALPSGSITNGAGGGGGSAGEYIIIPNLVFT